MDPVSHALLGASLGYGAFGHKLGRTAAWAGAAAALVPDVDIFIHSAADPLLAVEYHRHFTHALLFAPLGAGLVALPWVARSTWRSRALALWLCCLTAYVSHCLLDAATSFGTQLWWPLSDARYGWDLISIVDPVFTLILGLGAGVAIKRQKVWVVRAALGVGAAYLAMGSIQHGRAAAAQRQLAAGRGHVIERFEVMPTFANNLVWRALYRHAGRVYSDRIRAGLFSSPTVREGWSLPLLTERELTEAERERNQRRSFERFRWFSEGWVARQPSDGTILGDARYSLSAERFEPVWGIRFTEPEAANEVEWVDHSSTRRLDRTEMKQEILGRDDRYRELSAVSGDSVASGWALPFPVCFVVKTDDTET